MRTGTLVRTLAVAGILAAAAATIVVDHFASAVRQDADNPVAGDGGINETEPVLQAAALAGSEGEVDVMVNTGEEGDAAEGDEEASETGGDDGGEDGDMNVGEPAADDPAADDSGSESPDNFVLAEIVASAAAMTAVDSGATAEQAAAAGAAAASVFVDAITAERVGKAAAMANVSTVVDSDGESESSVEAVAAPVGDSASKSGDGDKAGEDETGAENQGENNEDESSGAGATAEASDVTGLAANDAVAGDASATDESGDFSDVVLTPLDSPEPEETPSATDPDVVSERDSILIATPDGVDGSVCFPAHETVELRDGSTVAMADLQLGDEVRVGADEFSPVFMFTHRLRDEVHRFVTLSTAFGFKLTATPGHYVFSNGALVAAGTVRKGDELTLANGMGDTVVSVKMGMARGLYNPQTAHGSIVVSGILASTYTTAVEPAFAHVVLAPLRALNWLGLSFTSLESGGGALARIMPRGYLTQ